MSVHVYKVTCDKKQRGRWRGNWWTKSKKFELKPARPSTLNASSIHSHSRHFIFIFTFSCKIWISKFLIRCLDIRMKSVRGSGQTLILALSNWDTRSDTHSHTHTWNQTLTHTHTYTHSHPLTLTVRHWLSDPEVFTFSHFPSLNAHFLFPRIRFFWESILFVYYYYFLKNREYRYCASSH